MPQQIWRQGLAVFLLAFVFIALYWVGLPTDFNADLLTITLRGTSASSYSDLLLRIADPRTPAWLYPPSGLMEYLRPLDTILEKAYFDLFGTSLIPFHVTAAVGYGLFCFCLFVLISRWSKRKLYGWLAVALYLSFPSNVFNLLSTFSADFQQFLSVLCIASLLCFCRMTYKKTSRFSFLLHGLAWFLAVWLAIKLKSSEKILPFVCAAFLVWRLPVIRHRLSWQRIVVILGMLTASLILVIPFKSMIPQKAFSSGPYANEIQESLNLKDKMILGFDLKNMIKRTFYVPGGDFPFTTPIRRKEPKSFTENYGCFLGWFFWLSILLTPFLMFRYEKKITAEGTEGLFPQAYWMMLIWFAATVAGFASGAAVGDVRFLNFAYVPSLFILFFACRIWEERFFPGKISSWIFRTLLSAAVLITLIPNFTTYTKLAAHFGGMQNAVVRWSEDIYRSEFQTEPHGWELYQRYHELETRFMMTDWYELPSHWLETAQSKVAAEGTLYFLTRSTDSERLATLRTAGMKPLLWKRYDLVEAKPLIFRWFQALQYYKKLLTGRVKEQTVFVYRIGGPASTGKSPAASIAS
ncbi:MAG: hypothetical protein ABH891_01195 [Candidatus Omnitrophota bacterium]